MNKIKKGTPYDNSVHIYHLPIDKKLFRKFKAECVIKGWSMKDKIADLINNSLD